MAHHPIASWLGVIAFALLMGVATFGVINAFVRPLVMILTLPLTIVTLGFFVLILNGAMLALAAWLLPGFHVTGFWSAVWGALIVSVVSGIGSWIFGPKGRVEVNFIRRD